MEALTGNEIFIRESDQRYPLKVQQIRRILKNVSLPEKATVKTFQYFGFQKVTMLEKPLGDVVTEGPPLLLDGVYTQNWISRDFNEEELLKIVEEKRAKLVSLARSSYQNCLRLGFQIEVSGGSDYFSLKDGDRLRYLSLLAVGDRTKKVRVKSNTGKAYDLTIEDVRTLFGSLVEKSEALELSYDDLLNRIRTVQDPDTFGEIPELC